jgi:uncharacterized membrane protein
MKPTQFLSKQSMKNGSILRSLLGWNVAMYILALLAPVSTLIILPSLPARVPAHYGITGEVDRWGSKYETLTMSGIMIVLLIIWTVLEHVLARRTVRSESETDAKRSVRFFILGGICAFALFDVVNTYILWMSKTGTTSLNVASVSFPQIINIVIGLVLIITGNFMPQAKPNTFSGVRLPSAYASRETWRRCQRMGGIAFIMVGAVIFICGLFVNNGAITMSALLIAIITATIAMMVYAPYAARKYGAIGGPIRSKDYESTETEDGKN